MCAEKRSDSQSRAMEGERKMETIQANPEAAKEIDSFVKGLKK